MKTWGFLGCGKLAQSLLTGALEKKLLSSEQILVTNRTPEKIQEFIESSGVELAKSNSELILRSDVILIGTKPGDILPVLDEVGRHDISKKVIVSLAAGVGEKVLARYLSKAQSFLRVMSNTPTAIQKGLFGIYAIKASPEDRGEIETLFNRLGTVVPLKSDKEVDLITSASASGVGFIYFIMEEFEKFLIQKKFSRSEARKIVVKTFLGAAELADARPALSLKELREAVTSKKGTTFAGLQAFKEAKLTTGLRSGLVAAFERSVEVGKSLLNSTKIT